MAKVLRPRAFIMTRSRRVTVFGLGRNLRHKNFELVEGRIDIDGVDSPLYLIRARRIKLGDTTPPTSLFIAVFSLDPPPEVKSPDAQAARGIRAVSNLRVTVTNNPSTFGDPGAKGAEPKIAVDQIKVPDLAESDVEGPPDLPGGAIEDD